MQNEIENTNTENKTDNITNSSTGNNVMTSNTSSHIQNIVSNTIENVDIDLPSNSISDNIISNTITVENTTYDENAITLDDIHQDLGIICTFLIIFAVALLVKIILKFFNMFF